MSKKVLLCFLGLGTLALVLSGLWGAGVIGGTKAASGPKLRVPGCSATFLGKGRPGEHLSGSVILQNVGSEPLEFWTTPGSRAISSLEPRQGTIEPHGTVELKVAVRLQEQGREEHAVVSVHTNDPATPVYRHLFLAGCPAPLEVFPGVIAFGTVLAGSSPTCTLRVQDPEGMPLSPAAIEVVSSCPFLTFERQAASRRQVVLVARLSEVTPKGDIRGEVRIRRAQTEGEIVIPVSACVRGMIRTAPETVYLSSHLAADEQREVASVLVWRADGKPVGPVEAIAKPDWLSVQERDSGNPKRRYFELRAVREPGEQAAATVRIRFADAAEEAVVDVATQW